MNVPPQQPPQPPPPPQYVNATGIVRIFLLTVVSNTSFDNSTQRNLTSYNDTWTEIGNFTDRNPRAYDSFGFQMACSTDGSIIAVSAPYREDPTNIIDGDQTDTGFVSIFRLSRNSPSNVSVTFIQAIQLSRALNPSRSDGFGVSMDLSDDGTVLAVTTKATLNAASRRGIFIYTRQPQANSTFSLAQFVGRNTRSVLSSHGNNLAMTPDGSIIAYRSNNLTDDEVTILERTGPTNWTYSAQINKNPDQNDRTWFGRTLAFHTNSDNNNIQLFIGSPNAGGIIYIYERISAGNWQEISFERRINQPEYSRTTLFGWSVDLRTTPLGEFMIVGAPINVNNEKGQALLYQFTNNSKLNNISTFQPLFQVISSVIVFDPNVPLIPGSSGDYFGSKVLLSDTHFAVGAINERPGAVYIYRLPPLKFDPVTPVTPPGDVPEFPPAPDDGGDGTRGRTIILGLAIGLSLFALLLIIAGVVAGILIYKYMRKKKIKELQERMMQMNGGADGAAPAN